MTRRQHTATRVPFTVGTFNLGARGHEDATRVARKCDVLGIQQGSKKVSQQAVLHAAAVLGYKALTFVDMPGGPATPLLYNPRVLLLVRPLFVPLLRGGTNVGPGTGPDHAKAKNLQGGYFVHKATRRRVAVGNLHLLAGQRGTFPRTANRRRELSAQMLGEIAVRLQRYGGVPILLGDFNTKPDAPTTEPLRARRWVSNHQTAAGPLATHGKHWNPDQIWWRPDRGVDGSDRRLRFRGHHTIPTRSDHDALIVEFGLKERGAR